MPFWVLVTLTRSWDLVSLQFCNIYLFFAPLSFFALSFVYSSTLLSTLSWLHYLFEQIPLYYKLVLFTFLASSGSSLISCISIVASSTYFFFIHFFLFFFSFYSILVTTVTRIGPKDKKCLIKGPFPVQYSHKLTLKVSYFTRITCKKVSFCGNLIKVISIHFYMYECCSLMCFFDVNFHFF